MLRILGQISISGTKASVERCASLAPIPAGIIKQLGLKRKVPDVDSWCYASPWYRFHTDAIDDEIGDFIAAHAQLETVLAVPPPGIAHAFFTLCPVEQSYDEEFSCALGSDIVRAISSLGIGLQIAPAAVMPDAPYWSNTGAKRLGFIR